jgi:hypothetical protein
MFGMTSAPVIIGGFSTNNNASSYWKFLTKYIHDNSLSFVYWAYNPDSKPESAPDQ